MGAFDSRLEASVEDRDVERESASAKARPMPRVATDAEASSRAPSLAHRGVHDATSELRPPDIAGSKEPSASSMCRVSRGHARDREHSIYVLVERGSAYQTAPARTWAGSRRHRQRPKVRHRRSVPRLSTGPSGAEVTRLCLPRRRCYERRYVAPGTPAGRYGMIAVAPKRARTACCQADGDAGLRRVNSTAG